MNEGLSTRCVHARMPHLPVGLEDAANLIADLNQALAST